MYSRNNSTWLKHWDFILLDLVMFQIAYICSYVIRMGIQNPYGDPTYLNIGGIICLIDLCAVFFTEPYHGIMRRGYFLEFKSTLNHVFLVCAVEAGYLFLSKRASAFSRLSFIWFIMTAIVLIYAERIIWKQYLVRHKRLFYEKVKMFLVTTRDEADNVLERMKLNSFNEFEIIGIAYAGETPKENERVRSIPVVCRADEIPDYIQTRWVDAVLLNVNTKEALPDDLINTLITMGVTVHQKIAELGRISQNQRLQAVGGYVVLSSNIRIAAPRQLFMKRLIDIIGAVAGLAVTVVLTVIIAPIIYMNSPGPIFFSQTRVGRNGRKFKIYKFRSMYPDAEQRKKDLMKDNQMNGYMFKMDADPRVIGSGPDGTRHGIGWFIRKTSIDEFPQFWNVLKGEMSLVGTRPPTVDEWEKYQYHHRGRLAVKPGLTGLWQVSGRSSITDFEEVVRLDVEYIQKWDMGLDIKILLRTIWVVLSGRGAE